MAKLGICIDFTRIPNETYRDIPELRNAERFHAVLRVGPHEKGKPFLASPKIVEGIASHRLADTTVIGNIFFDLFHDSQRLNISNYEPVREKMRPMMQHRGIGTWADIMVLKWLILRNRNYGNYHIFTGVGSSKERQIHIEKRGRRAGQERTIAEELRAAQQQAIRNNQRNKPKPTSKIRKWIRQLFRRRK